MSDNKKLYSMKRTYLLSLVVALLAICSCTKVEVIDVQGEVIAIKEVPKTAGEFMLPITVKGNPRLVWRAVPVSDWLHVSDSNWKRNAYNVTISYDSNESSMYDRNFARVGHIVVETYDGFVSDTIVVKQRGITPYMELSDVTVEATQTECEMVFNTNLIDDCRSGLTLTADADWVESIEYLGNGTHLLVKFGANEGDVRTTTLTASFTDACGINTIETCQLTQQKAEE